MYLFRQLFDFKNFCTTSLSNVKHCSCNNIFLKNISEAYSNPLLNAIYRLESKLNLEAAVLIEFCFAHIF